jgi:hypothetical protein
MNDRLFRKLLKKVEEASVSYVDVRFPLSSSSFEFPFTSLLLRRMSIENCTIHSLIPFNKTQIINVNGPFVT